GPRGRPLRARWWSWRRGRAPGGGGWAGRWRSWQSLISAGAAPGQGVSIAAGRRRSVTWPSPAGGTHNPPDDPPHLAARRVIASPPMAKSPCPVSKTQFLDKAEPVKIVIGNAEIIADKREFSTGSFGWYYNGKTTVTVDGKPLSVQVGLNLTVVGSKEAER